METRSKRQTPTCNNLHYVAAHGFVEELRTLIEQQADVNELDENGFSPVFYAVSQNRAPQMLQTLIDAKADPNVASRDATGTCPAAWVELLEQRRALSTSGHNHNLSPLTWATLKKSAAKVKILINAKADVNFMNVRQDKGSTALFLAVEMGSLDIVKLLVEAKAVLDVLNHEAYTVLDVAERKGHHDITNLLVDANAPRGMRWRMQQACIDGRIDEVKLLLDAGYILQLQSPYGEYPLVLAVQHNHTDIAQMLIAARAQLDVPDTSPLLLSIKNKNLELINLLVAAHADVNVRDNVHCPIRYSIETDNLDLAEFLIDARADVDLTPHWSRRTALCVAAERGNINAARLLIDAKAHLNPSADNWTPLASAAENGQLEMMQLLLESKAVIDAAAGKRSPLLAAVDNQRVSAIKLLLEAKAATDIPGTNYADTLLSRALDIAMKSQNDDVLRLLLDANPSLALKQQSTKVLGPLYKQKRFSTLELLLEKHASVDGATVDRVPIFCQAVSDHRTPVVKLMIDAKANVNVRGSYGNTPLILACCQRYRDIVELLIEAKATLDARDGDGYTALRHSVTELHSQLRQPPVDESIVQMLVDAKVPVDYNAVRAAVEGRRLEVVKILIDAKADLCARNKYGDTLLMVASESKSPSIIDILLTADPSLLDQRGAKGMTALMLAVINHRPPEDANMVKMLLEQVWTHCVREYNDEKPPAKRFKGTK